MASLAEQVTIAQVYTVSGAEVCKLSEPPSVRDKTLKELKELIALEVNIPAHEQQLLLDGDLLVDPCSKPLTDAVPDCVRSLTLVHRECTFVLQNHWDTPSNNGRCGMILGLDVEGEPTCQLKEQPSILPEVLPWQIKAVPPQHSGGGENRYYIVHETGRVLGVSGTRLCLKEEWDPELYKDDYVPWEFCPVPAGHPFSDEKRYYIINRWQKPGNDEAFGQMIGFGGHTVILEERWKGGAHAYDMVPWELINHHGQLDCAACDGVTLSLRNQWNTHSNNGRCGMVLASALEMEGEPRGELKQMPKVLPGYFPWRAVAVPPEHPGSGLHRYYIIHESGKVLSFQSGDDRLCLGEPWDNNIYREGYVPWEFFPVPDNHPFHCENRYYIINRYGAISDIRFGKMMGFHGHNLVLEERWRCGSHTYDMVPWALRTCEGTVGIEEAGGESVGLAN